LIELHNNTKLLCIKGYYQQIERAMYGIRENICKSCICLKITIQNQGADRSHLQSQLVKASLGKKLCKTPSQAGHGGPAMAGIQKSQSRLDWAKCETLSKIQPEMKGLEACLKLKRAYLASPEFKP
jgi:hypothetical protein